MSGPFHPSAAPGAEQRENTRVLSERLGETYYAVERGAGTGAVLGGAAFVFRAAGQFTYVLFPNAATTRWAFPVKVRKDWRRMGVRWTVWYTSPGAGTANFSVGFGAAPYGAAGDNLGALADLFSSGQSLPGPAVAEDVLTFTYVQTAAPLGTYRPWVSLRLVRNDPDANANDLWVLSAYVELFSV